MKRFTTSDEYLRNVFLISDYSVKAVEGAQYDVLYQDRKEEEPVGKDELLEELADCYRLSQSERHYVRNALD